MLYCISVSQTFGQVQWWSWSGASSSGVRVYNVGEMHRMYTENLFVGAQKQQNQPAFRKNIRAQNSFSYFRMHKQRGKKLVRLWENF